jgi:hypothetical protein
MRGPLLLGPRPVAARRGVGGSSIRILGVAAVALALLALWRGLYLRDDVSSDVTEVCAVVEGRFAHCQFGG